MDGVIARLAPEAGFGFIECEGKELFFHRNALQGVEFEELAPGSAVVFEVDRDPQGDRPGEHPRAVNIKLAADQPATADHEPLPERKIA
jgi:cold shock CspA family protein